MGLFGSESSRVIEQIQMILWEQLQEQVTRTRVKTEVELIITQYASSASLVRLEKGEQLKDKIELLLSRNTDWSAWESIIAELQSRVGEAERLNSTHAISIKEYQNSIGQLRCELETSSSMFIRERTSAQEMQSTHHRQITALHQKVRELEVQIAANKARYQSDVKEMSRIAKRELDEAVAGLQHEWEKERSRTVAIHDRELQDAHEKHNQKRDALKDKIEKLTNTYEDQLSQQRAEHEAALAEIELEYEGSMQKLKMAHNERIENQQMEHEKTLADAQERDYERKQELLTLQDRLQKRDNYIGLKDSEILNGKLDEHGELEIYGLATLLTEVKKAAAWTWKEDRVNWPHELMLELTGDKQNRLKRLVLGDLIWTTLFHALFCSPFRLLGEIGKKLEDDWTGNFGQGASGSGEYCWPPPSLDSEKWRYDTCQDALSSITKPAAQFSESGRLKMSFFRNRKIMREQFHENVASLVDLDAEKETILDDILFNAVRMWLNFSIQRYRLYLTIPGSVEPDQGKKMTLAGDGELVFTVMPQLQRFGNAKGLELGEVSIVSGCEGKTGSIMD